MEISLVEFQIWVYGLKLGGRGVSGGAQHSLSSITYSYSLESDYLD